MIMPRRSADERVANSRDERVANSRASHESADATDTLAGVTILEPRACAWRGDRCATLNLLPARQFGKIILTTSYGIMDHEEARRKHTGGKILGFFY